MPDYDLSDPDDLAALQEQLAACRGARTADELAHRARVADLESQIRRTNAQLAALVASCNLFLGSFTVNVATRHVNLDAEKFFEKLVSLNDVLQLAAYSVK